jgi:hypothetical protein
MVPSRVSVCRSRPLTTQILALAEKLADRIAPVLLLAFGAVAVWLTLTDVQGNVLHRILA